MSSSCYHSAGNKSTYGDFYNKNMCNFTARLGYRLYTCVIPVDGYRGNPESHLWAFNRFLLDNVSSCGVALYESDTQKGYFYFISFNRVLTSVVVLECVSAFWKWVECVRWSVKPQFLYIPHSSSHFAMRLTNPWELRERNINHSNVWIAILASCSDAFA